MNDRASVQTRAARDAVQALVASQIREVANAGLDDPESHRDEAPARKAVADRCVLPSGDTPTIPVGAFIGLVSLPTDAPSTRTVAPATKFDPLIVIVVSPVVGPDVGDTDVMAGAGAT